MDLKAGVSSNVGLVRQTNEDSFLVRRGLYVVCDGMGGARAGEVASELACWSMLSLDPAAAGPDDLLAAVKGANRAIGARSLEEPRLLGMGTTLTGALVKEGAASLVHVGDSRAYLLHEGALRQVTDDHSWVGEMIRRGEMTPDEAAVHPHRSVITRALGTDVDVQPDLFEVLFEVGDRLLLCSDGLTGMVSDVDIADILGMPEEPQTLASLLVQAALAGGGEDNVTVIVVAALPDGEGAAAAEDKTSEPILGPTDRGSAGTQRAGIHPLKGRRPGVAVRERLGKKVGPLLRPPAGPGRSSGAAPSPSPAASPSPPPSRSSDVEPDPPSMAAGEEAPILALAEAAPLPEVAAPVVPGRPVDRRRRRRWAVLVAAVILVIAAGVGGFAVLNSTVYYVGESGGGVALYRGLPGSLLGVELSRVVEQGSVTYDSLAPYVQTRVDAHDLVTKEEGQNFLRSLSPMP